MDDLRRGNAGQRAILESKNWQQKNTTTIEGTNCYRDSHSTSEHFKQWKMQVVKIL